MYIHNRYAGNKGDLWKHFILNEVVTHLSPHHILDSHGGFGFYHLQPGHEWKRGLGEISHQQRLMAADAIGNGWFMEIWRRYQESATYLGSWSQLLTQFGLLKVTVCDHSPEVIDMAVKYAEQLGVAERSHFLVEDSFKLLADSRSLEQDFHFIDPAYSLKDGLGDDWIKLESILADHSTPFLVWYPLYGPKKPVRLIERTKTVGIELHWSRKRISPYVPSGCGLLVNQGTLKQLDHRFPIWELFAGCLGSKLYIRRH